MHAKNKLCIAFRREAITYSSNVLFSEFYKKSNVCN